MVEPGPGPSPGTASSINNGSPEINVNGNNETIDLEDNKPVRETKMERNSTVAEDVAPVFILQPKEIIKNIDLMKTVAILMENKLQTSTTVTRRLDQERMKDLCSDIERFPEAFQKFISIIHQIQYLNVTSDWNFANIGEIPIVPITNRGSVISRLFGMETPQSHPDIAEYDARKQVLLYLLSTLQQVVIRYQKIQSALEERVKKYGEILSSAGEHAGKNTNKSYNNKCSNETDSDEDDPNLPLLETSKRRSLNNATNKIWVEKLESLHGILRRTKRSATEVQDSLEVLRDLILWDYKQAVCNAPPRTQSSEGNSTNFTGTSYNGRTTESMHAETGGLHSSQNNQMNHDFHQSASGRNPRRMWKLSALLAVILVVLVIVAALSFMKFHY